MVQKRVLCTGAGGFIASHLAKRLKDEGHYVVAADWKRNEYFKEEEFCNEFMLLDLRDFASCVKACTGIDEVYSLAADMGGIGFITSRDAAIMYSNALINLQMTEAARTVGTVTRYFYASSACAYPDSIQERPDSTALKESDAWPASPPDGYGLEKLWSEEVCRYYGKDFPQIQFRMARFHNIYGPQGTWKGGREKAPAAFCRKAYTCGPELEIWGDGEQTRSFCLVDDCVTGILKLMQSDITQPMNIGSDELISMNDMATMCLRFAGREAEVELKHIEGPQGVRGRNSDNTLIKAKLGWAPSTKLEAGLKKTFDWIKAEVDAEKAAGVDVAVYGQSKTVTTEAPPAIMAEGHVVTPDTQTM